MPRVHSDQTKRRFFHAIDNGESLSGVARKLQITRATGYRWLEDRKAIEAKLKASPVRDRMWEDSLPPPLFEGELSKEAARALEDFGYWRYRYLGRRSVPWQEEAADDVAKWILSPETEFVVLNEPPGSGKTTTFTHDIPAWLICRDRTIRILLGHRVQRIAQTYVARLRRTLQRTRPLPAGPGREAAIACLAEDYGRFKPTYNDAWRNDEFMVMLSIDEDTPDESALEDKEPTVAGFGMESEFLGTRANLVLWDDLVTGEILRSEDQILKQRQWWEEEGQTRVEPGGALLLLGQRMGGDDLYQYALDQRLDDGDERRYRHVIFPAHFDDTCKGDDYHQKDSPAWPDGCLLDPVRIPWYGKNGLLTIKNNTPAKYEIQYQQRDVAVSEVLVPRVWIDGGRDADGVEHPGCWDAFRSVGHIPRGLSAPYHSVVAVDPSASNWWAIGWWILHPASEQTFLIDLHHERMDGPDLLDWNANDGVFYGVLHDLAGRAKAAGAPITHLIVETNACQRWLLQYDHTKRWQREQKITIMPHSTGTNKLDPQLGIQSIKDKFRFGNIRLPGANDGSRGTVMPLVTEATRYEPAKPKARPDDCLMMAWFVQYHYHSIAKPRRDGPPPRLPVPSWAAA